MNGQFLYGTPYYKHTSYETIYCSVFEIRDIKHLEGIKTPFLISTEMNGQFL